MSSCYDDALCFGTDRSERSKVKQETEKVIEAMGTCNSQVVEVRYFARKAFKNRPAVLRQFGLNEYSKVRKSQSKMVLFMHEFVETVNIYKPELLAANLKESVIEALKPATERLTAINTTQENTKDNSANFLQEKDTALMLGIEIQFTNGRVDSSSRIVGKLLNQL